MPVVLGLALAALGCTRPNPAFEHGTAPADAEDPTEEVPPDAAPRRDTSTTPPAADAVGLPPDAMPPAPDVTIAPADTAAPDAAPDAASAGISSTGLLGYWPLDEARGSTMASDRSGNGNNGTLAMVDQNSAWMAGHAGSALEIPNVLGAGVVVKASPSLDRIRTSFTISAWVYRVFTARSLTMAVLSRQFSTANRELYTLSFKDDTLVLWLYAVAPAAQIKVSANRTAPTTTWIHVAATWDGQMVRLYQDGAQVGMGTYAGPLNTSSNPVILGNNANQSGIDQPLGGRLDEVRLYDRALSPGEIAALAGK